MSFWYCCSLALNDHTTSAALGLAVYCSLHCSPPPPPLLQLTPPLAKQDASLHTVHCTGPPTTNSPLRWLNRTVSKHRPFTVTQRAMPCQAPLLRLASSETALPPLCSCNWATLILRARATNFALLHGLQSSFVNHPPAHGYVCSAFSTKWSNSQSNSACFHINVSPPQNLTTWHSNVLYTHTVSVPTPLGFIIQARRLRWSLLVDGVATRMPSNIGIGLLLSIVFCQVDTVTFAGFFPVDRPLPITPET